MQPIKRDMFFFVAATALVFLCALAWGKPFLRSAPASSAVPAQAQPVQPMVFNGTVVRSGGQLVLRDSSGQVFRLEDARLARAFENRAVSITGRVDTGRDDTRNEGGAKTIRIERIEIVRIGAAHS